MTTINSQMSDAELAALLARGGQPLIVDAANEARKLYERTKTISLPRRALDAEHVRYRRTGFERRNELPPTVEVLRAALNSKSS